MRPAKADTITPNLATIVGGVLGDMAFLVEDDHQEKPVRAQAWLECSVTFSGPAVGTLRCWCTHGFATQLAANLLGSEADDEEVCGGAIDALREFMNVVCGQLVTAWYGTGQVFNLSIPAVKECGHQPRFDSGRGDTVCRLSVSGQPFYCMFRPCGG
jgi:CheY-specific phosphatase CheX